MHCRRNLRCQQIYILLATMCRTRTKIIRRSTFLCRQRIGSGSIRRIGTLTIPPATLNSLPSNGSTANPTHRMTHAIPTRHCGRRLLFPVLRIIGRSSAPTKELARRPMPWSHPRPYPLSLDKILPLWQRQAMWSICFPRLYLLRHYFNGVMRPRLNSPGA